MKLLITPTDAQLRAQLQRPQSEKGNINEIVNSICQRVKEQGDSALYSLTRALDKADLKTLTVSKKELREAKIPLDLSNAIKTAKNNIERFHQFQKRNEIKLETSRGIICWKKTTAIENVGLYIPGGSAPLFSTLLMLAIPAKIAGCKNIQICTPPNKEGEIAPEILYTAQLLGIDKIFKVGGAQAIAAMTYGTESISKVEKIFGPGNQYVNIAKQQMQQEGIVIDMPAGPSELLIIADENANPQIIAADLLSQAEHGPDSQVVLLTNSLDLALAVENCVKNQLHELPRKEIATASLKYGVIAVLANIKDCLEWSNYYAPEHLSLNMEQAELALDKINNAGSVFLGQWAAEALGDYASGTNHTLPTSGTAKAWSGLGLESFQKSISVQKVEEQGLLNIADTVITMAQAEQLQAHANATAIRRKIINREKENNCENYKQLS